MCDVSSAGITRQSSTTPRVSPPPLPSSATTRTPLARAAWAARTTLGLSPLVECSTTRSPGRARASIWRAKISSKPQAVPAPVGNAVSGVHTPACQAGRRRAAGEPDIEAARITSAELAAGATYNNRPPGCAATASKQIGDPNPKRELRVWLGKVTVADVWAAQPVALNVGNVMVWFTKMTGVTRLQWIRVSPADSVALGCSWKDGKECTCN